MSPVLPGTSSRLQTRLLIIILVALAAAVFAFTWFSIRESRSDSFLLLVEQGRAFTEALAQASENAIVAASFYDRLAEERYQDLVATLADDPLSEMDRGALMRFVELHDLLGVQVFAMDSSLAIGVTQSPRYELPPFVIDEVYELINNPQIPFVLLVDSDDRTGETIHYFVSLTNNLDRVIVLSSIAIYHSQAYQQTGIGYLAQNMAREQGVEYIIYQSPEGIIFSSRKPGSLPAIESDPFLSAALTADTISHRVYDFQGQRILELVRPFATEQYPIGVFRVGLSLKKFHNISRGFDLRMLVLAGALFAFLVFVILYLISRRERRRLTRQYSEIKSLTDKIFDEMRTGVAAIDHQHQVVLTNDAFNDIFSIADPRGRAWEDVIAEPILAIDEFMGSGKVTDETELTIRRNSDERTLLVARSKVLFSERGEDPGLVIVVYDVTRLKQYEKQSARRQRLSELGNLAAGVAHEIRNPLNTISIAVQRLASEFEPTVNKEEYTEFVRTIRGETSRLNEIITRFLALAREETQNHKPVDVHQLIADMVKLMQAEAEGLNITMETDIARGLLVRADPDRLKQVFINLFNNAKEALAGKSGTVRISGRKLNDGIELNFEDSGPGIPEEERERVVTPYFTTKEAGTGLGLPTVHSIVTEMGGDLRIDASDLGGARITMLLPSA